jgi:hypothetical protein
MHVMHRNVESVCAGLKGGPVAVVELAVAAGTESECVKVAGELKLSS